MEQYIENKFKNYSPIVKQAYKDDPVSKEEWKYRLIKNYGGPWEFNEIIGYIKLYFYGSQIRGEYWIVNAKKIVKTRKKQFEFETFKLAPELTIDDKTNNGILRTVWAYIESCNEELVNRYIDIREFEKLAPHINWVSLYNEKHI